MELKMTGTTPPEADTLAASINALDVALNAILNVLETKHPGLKAEAFTEVQRMLAQLPAPSPPNTATRDLMQRNLRQIFGQQGTI